MWKDGVSQSWTPEGMEEVAAYGGWFKMTLSGFDPRYRMSATCKATRNCGTQKSRTGKSKTATSKTATLAPKVKATPLSPMQQALRKLTPAERMLLAAMVSEETTEIES